MISIIFQPSPPNIYREQAGKHPNRSSTNFEEGEDADGADEGGDLRLNIRRARLCVVNWTWGWGPENRWEKRFNDELQAARRISLSNMDAFFVRIGEHTAEGREILEQLKCAASFECDCTMGEVKDLFLQGYDMVVQVTSEVKFLESKVDQFAPAVSYSKLSDIHYYVEV